MKSLEGQFTETLIYQDQSRAEQTKMIADSAEGARREVPQLMQVKQVVLVKMWMITMAVNEVIRTEMVGMRAN